MLLRSLFGNISVNKVTSNTLKKGFLWDITRYTSFFNKLPAAQIWKGVTSVSNAGKKRGRGKGAGRKLVKDLNRGQVIGIGKENILWPGLNSPVIRGREMLKQQRLPEDPEREKNILKLRDAVRGFRSLKLNPLDRGYSGTKMPGRSIGPPDPVGQSNFEGFDTRVVEHKLVFVMKGNLGRRRRFSVMSVTGNGKGLAGFATTKAPDTVDALRKSKNRAGQKLMKIELCDNRTIFHDFYCAFGKTKIFVTKKPEGYGLICHRVIKTICQVIGINDLHAKVEGSTNVQHIVKAFFIGLLKQKTHKQIADKKGLHVVEFRNDYDILPRVVASPEVCREASDVKKDEEMDFKQYIMNNKVVLKRKRFPPFYVSSKGYQLYCIKNEYNRNKEQVRINMMIQYNELTSFLLKKS